METAITDKIQPLRRHDALKPLSREHHDGLLLCWKIRRGLKKTISPERIASYTKYFFSTRLWPHFALEEREVFPLLGKSELVAEAKEQHRRLGQLFLIAAPDAPTLELTQQLLEKHIRFEERVLFSELQEKVAAPELERALANHDEHGPEETWDDKFWL
jgi:hemerythrin-like domain-containing protein